MCDYSDPVTPGNFKVFNDLAGCWTQTMQDIIAFMHKKPVHEVGTHACIIITNAIRF